MDAQSVARNGSPHFNLKLGVVTHVKHWVGGNERPIAYEPYVREMRVWADLFSEVEIYAPRAEGPIRGNQASYDRPNIVWRQLTYNGEDGNWARLTRLFQLPVIALDIRRLMKRSDLLHLRSPGHPALVASVLVRMFASPAITKYAGLFGPFSEERPTARFERWLLRRPSKRHCAMVYGPSSEPHLLTFQPALMDNSELRRASELAAEKIDFRSPYHLIAVGTLIPVKGFDLALKGLATLRRQRPDLLWELTLVGDGPEAGRLRELATQSDIGDRVRFTGALPFVELQKLYGRAHVMIMPGVQEGWPKTIAEAWAHGAIPVAAEAGIVPWILREGSGVLFPPNPEGLAQVLANLMDSPERMRSMAVFLTGRAQDLSLESFRNRLEKVLIEFFNFSVSEKRDGIKQSYS